jgi:[ribosomal protein S5]-alanine N-acetyltransferase
MTEIKTFETERLILKPTSEDDAEFVFRLLNTPKWHQYIGDRNIKSIENARQYIKDRMIAQVGQFCFANYTLIRKSDSVKMGTCGLYNRGGVDGIDIGFAFLAEYEKMGYAFEAASKLRDLAFSEFGINSLSAITAKENTSSQKLLERLGMKLTSTTILPDTFDELLLYKSEAN